MTGWRQSPESSRPLVELATRGFRVRMDADLVQVRPRGSTMGDTVPAEEKELLKR